MRKATVSILLPLSLGLLAGCGGSSSSGTDAVSTFVALPNDEGKTFVTKVSGNGQVTLGLQTNTREFIYWNGIAGPLTISLSGGLSTQTIDGVSADGSTFAGELDGSSTTGAYRYNLTDGVTEIPPPAGVTDYTVATDISADGSVVVGETRPLSGNYRAFYWTSGTSHLLPEITANTKSVPLSVCADGHFLAGQENGHPARWSLSDGGGVIALSDEGGTADDCSSDGSVIVGRIGDSSSATAFRWTASGGVESLGLAVLPGIPLSISGDGKKIVGTLADSTPFVWTRGKGMRDLATDFRWSVTPFEGLINVYAKDISQDGKTIVGGGQSATSSGVSIGWRLTLR
jgi:probable HAF family extracellular repeat protein